MTQHHHTPPPDPMPLDPEERALAARLARLGPHGEPSPALDARVLAAAHAATAGGVAGRRGSRGQHGWRRARWPVGVGVAASVVLAAGIAWQMRPLPAPVVPAAETVAAAPATAAADAAAVVAAAGAIAQPMPMPPPETAAATVIAPEAPAASPRPPAVARTVAAKASAPPAEAPVVFDAPSPVDVQAPPPAPPAPPAPTASPAPAATAPVAAQKQQAAARAASSTTQAQAQAQQAPMVFGADTTDAPEADVPPATAASPAVRDAWLARIRELAAAGRTDEARASLAEFRRRYPAFAIPGDLRPLLPAPATSSPPQQ